MLAASASSFSLGPRRLRMAAAGSRTRRAHSGTGCGRFATGAAVFVTRPGRFPTDRAANFHRRARDRDRPFEVGNGADAVRDRQRLVRNRPRDVLEVHGGV
jgi:hypothetical protein